MNYNNIFDKFKGKYVFYITCALSAVMASALAFVAYGEINSKAGNDSGYKIVLDPGHGGEDGGAVGQEGIVEKDINLKRMMKHQRIILVIKGSFDVSRLRRGNDT